MPMKTAALRNSGDGRVRLVLDPFGLLTNLHSATESAKRKASA